MKFGARVKGLSDLKKTLESVMPREAKNILRRTTYGLGIRVRDRLKERAPEDTGDLKRSIKIRRSRGTRTRIEVEIIADKSGGRTGRGLHAHFLEFGTVKMRAQPFIVPGVEEIRPEIPHLYRQEFGVQYERELAKRKKS